MKFRGILYLVIVCILTSCGSNEDDWAVTETPKLVSFQSSFVEEQGAQLRAQGNSWDAQDSIGVFMKQAGQALSGASVIDGAENKKYITTGSGDFSSFSENDRIYYPSGSVNVDFIAYYPYSHGIKNYIVPVDISDQKSQEAIDLLYSDNIKDINKNSSKAMALRFNHQLVKIRLNISLQDGSRIPDGLEVTISGMKTKASFALNNGTLSVDASSGKDIPVKVISGSTGTVAEAIVFPQEAMGSRVIKLTAPTIGSYTWNIPATEQYEKGKKYTYNITLN